MNFYSDPHFVLEEHRRRVDRSLRRATELQNLPLAKPALVSLAMAWVATVAGHLVAMIAAAIPPLAHRRRPAVPAVCCTPRPACAG